MNIIIIIIKRENFQNNFLKHFNFHLTKLTIYFFHTFPDFEFYYEMLFFVIFI
jgi:hypothetical protein